MPLKFPVSVRLSPNATIPLYDEVAAYAVDHGDATSSAAATTLAATLPPAMLLAAVAEQGFAELSDLLHGVVDNEQVALDERLHQAVLGYLDFALEQPALYELMFGQALWQADAASNQTPSTLQFQRTAKDCFRQYVHLFERLQGQSLSPQSPLRSAQLLWATLHGLAQLSRNGLFVKREDLADIAAHALAQFPRRPA